MSKEVMNQALEAQEHMKLSRDYARLPGYPLSDADRQMEKSTTTLREALAKQPAEQEQVTHAIIAGALFDFMGWLTSRKERLSLSSSDDASPVVMAITEFAKMRGLSLDDAKVIDWYATLQSPAQQEPVAWQDYANHMKLVSAEDWENIDPMWHWMYRPLYTSPPAQRTWVGLTDEETAEIFDLNKRTLGGGGFHGVEAMYLRDFEDAVAAIEAKLKEKNT